MTVATPYTYGVYENNKAVGGGAIRKYDDENIELKRVFVHTEYQGKGIGSKLVSLLIEWAAELGYKRMILETGELLVESGAVYKNWDLKFNKNLISNDKSVTIRKRR